MKKIFAILAISLTVLLVSCYEINELIEIKENGSGTYATKMDMSALLDIMESMGGAKELEKEGLDKKMDTTIFFRSFTDTATNLSAAEKKIYSSGKMHMLMDMSKKKFIMDLDFKFDDLQELQMLMSGVGTSNMSQGLKSIFGGKDSTTAPLEAPKDMEMDQMTQMYDVKVESNKISKTLNKQKYDELMNKPEMAQMQQFAGAGIEILMTSVIKLPRPVKKSDNAMMKLSDDKRTVTLKYNLIDAIQTPDKYGFVIEY
ncbi:MAG: hypothetical protein ACXWV4_08060 [Flavitalea sp.]